MIAPFDKGGSLCGFVYGPVDMTGYDYLYFTNAVSGLDVNDVLANGICVKACPSATEMVDTEFWETNC